MDFQWDCRPSDGEWICVNGVGGARVTGACHRVQNVLLCVYINTLHTDPQCVRTTHTAEVLLSDPSVAFNV